MSKAHTACEMGAFPFPLYYTGAAYRTCLQLAVDAVPSWSISDHGSRVDLHQLETSMNWKASLGTSACPRPLQAINSNIRIVHTSPETHDMICAYHWTRACHPPASAAPIPSPDEGLSPMSLRVCSRSLRWISLHQ